MPDGAGLLKQDVPTSIDLLELESQDVPTSIDLLELESQDVPTAIDPPEQVELVYYNTKQKQKTLQRVSLQILIL